MLRLISVRPWHPADSCSCATGPWLLLVLVSLLGLTACENDLAEVNRLINAEETKQEVAHDVQMFYSDSAEVHVRVRATTMIRHLDKAKPRQEFMDGVTVEFLGNRQGGVSSQLSADYALRFENENRVIMRDSVVWQSPNGEQLETEELIWEEKTGRVYSNKFVVIRRPNEIVYGYGFESDQDFSFARIKAIEGTLAVDPLKN